MEIKRQRKLCSLYHSRVFVTQRLPASCSALSSFCFLLLLSVMFFCLLCYLFIQYFVILLPFLHCPYSSFCLYFFLSPSVFLLVPFLFHYFSLSLTNPIHSSSVSFIFSSFLPSSLSIFILWLIFFFCLPQFFFQCLFYSITSLFLSLTLFLLPQFLSSFLPFGLPPSLFSYSIPFLKYFFFHLSFLLYLIQYPSFSVPPSFPSSLHPCAHRQSLHQFSHLVQILHNVKKRHNYFVCDHYIVCMFIWMNG